MLPPLGQARRHGRLVIELAHHGTVVIAVDLADAIATATDGQLSYLFSGTCKPCRRGFNQTCVYEEINGVTRDGGCTHPLS